MSWRLEYEAPSEQYIKTVDFLSNDLFSDVTLIKREWDWKTTRKKTRTKMSIYQYQTRAHFKSWIQCIRFVTE